MHLPFRSSIIIIATGTILFSYVSNVLAAVPNSSTFVAKFDFNGNIIAEWDPKTNNNLFFGSYAQGVSGIISQDSLGRRIFLSLDKLHFFGSSANLLNTVDLLSLIGDDTNNHGSYDEFNSSHQLAADNLGNTFFGAKDKVYKLDSSNNLVGSATIPSNGDSYFGICDEKPNVNGLSFSPAGNYIYAAGGDIVADNYCSSAPQPEWMISEFNNNLSLNYRDDDPTGSPGNGEGANSIKLSPDEQFAYLAVGKSSVPTIVKYKITNPRQEMWRKNIETLSGLWYGAGAATDVVLDSSDNVYVSYCYTNLGAQDKDIGIVKYDSFGNLIWKKSPSDSRYTYECAYGIAMDPAGNYVYLSGYQGVTSDDDLLFFKYRTADGDMEWEKRYDIGLDKHERHPIIAADSGGIYLYAIQDNRNPPDLYIPSSTTGYSVDGGTTYSYPLSSGFTAMTGTMVSFTAGVKNQGELPAGPSSTRMRFDEDNNGTWNISGIIQPTSSLNGGVTEYVNWVNAWSAKSGTHKIEFCADINGEVAESNETNNCRTQTFTVTITSLINAAAFISQSVPSTMNTGEVRSVSVTMKNCRSSGDCSNLKTWTQVDLYKLGQIPDSTDSQYVEWGAWRILLPVSSVASGGQVTFTFNITAPSTPGTYNFQRRMLTEGGGEWFGDLTSLVSINVISAPIVTSSTKSNITTTSATLGANVTSTGGSTINAYGTCWALTANPTLSTGDCVAACSSGCLTGIFTHSRSGFTANTLYYYRGYATNSVGTGYSADDTVLTLPGTPGTPTFASVAATTLTVNWTAPAGGAGGTLTYKIERCQDPDGGPACSPTSQIGTSDTTSYNDSGLTAGKTYRYRVRAANTTGDGGYSGVGSVTTLGNPTVTSPTATSITTTSATLGAEITSDGGSAILVRGICYGISSAPTTPCSTGGTATGIFTHSITVLNPNTAYYYRGYATNIVGIGYSAADGTFITLPNAPGMPTVSNLSRTDPAASTTLQVSWSEPTGGAASYKVYRCQGTGCNPSAPPIITGLASTNYNDSGLSPNTLYRYRIIATNAAGADGNQSFAAGRYTRPNAPGTPFFTDVTENSLIVNWTAPDGGSYTYQVWRCQNSGCSPNVLVDNDEANLSFYNSGLVASTLYRYNVRTKSSLSGLFSADSNIGEQTTAALANTPPLANITGWPSALVVGRIYTLTAGGSSDAEDCPSPCTGLGSSFNFSAYAWSIVTKPSGSTVVFSTPNQYSQSFTPDVGGTYAISLSVRDSDGEWSSVYNTSSSRTLPRWREVKP
ncbi:hypothetical protein A3E96_02035 [Candidatus Uhrbacteria bacterium RIFCSPHIGHO2_12_FULL_46_13]|nr:MAG: hypothetical protein A2752_03395 [Candidatus Uhrbacteria bacterium RIFCSPHIGHO2_01_FULL_46_23]OGL75992.1 MAG: hypothetical protein A3E96_02035 [Candidatus Uhrbacteria bacterium RIFCSPHIGHO2_12_FULL_46_13]